MTAISTPRRLACALVALSASGFLFRGQLAAAIVTRGDDAIVAGDERTAVAAYERALLLDPASAIAADRLAFRLALRHRPADARRAVAVATTALTRADEPSLHAARGFAESVLHEWHPAADDFARAAAESGDPRYRYLAGRLARRAASR
jgi:hypothetical protein